MMSTENTDMQPGWYESEPNSELLRYWNGERWLNMTRPASDIQEPSPAETEVNPASGQAVLCSETTNKPLRMNSILSIVFLIVACVVVIIVIAVQTASTANTTVREEGAWPDFEYLETLSNQPSQFLEAVNISELKDAYEKGGSDDGIYSADIDIDELDRHIAQSTEIVSSTLTFTIKVDDTGDINSFGLECSLGSPHDITECVNEDASLAQGALLYDIGVLTYVDYYALVIAWLADNGLADNGYLIVNGDSVYIKESFFTDYADDLALEYDTPDDLIYDYLKQPSALLESLGINPSVFSATEGWSAQDAWSDGYIGFLDLYNYAILNDNIDNIIETATPLSFSGKYYLDQIETEQGLLSLEISDTSNFYVGSYNDENDFFTIETSGFEIWYDTPNGNEGATWYDNMKERYESWIQGLNDDYGFEWETWDGSFVDEQDETTDATPNETDATNTEENTSTNSGTAYTGTQDWLTVTLPDTWNEDRTEKLTDSTVDLAFAYGERPSSEAIFCYTIPDAEYTIEEFTSEDCYAWYEDSASIFNVERTSLPSGSYYLIEGIGLNTTTYHRFYFTIVNGYYVTYEYISSGGENDCPHIDDFEEMVANAVY